MPEYSCRKLTSMLRQPSPPATLGAPAALLVVCAVLLAACAPRANREVGPRPSMVVVEREIPADREAWTLDQGASELRVLVYRSGTLARLGHNHVLRARDLDALAWAGPDGSPVGAGLDLRIPVAQFLVDDPADRAAAGPEFTAAVSDEARAGTLANLLRAEVLAAAEFPELLVRATVVSLVGTAAVARCDVTIRGITRAIEVPLELHEDDAGLVAAGRFALRQSEYGMEPFSIGGGAIAVADEVQVVFKLHFSRA
jgi:hypothetical protein